MGNIVDQNPNWLWIAHNEGPNKQHLDRISVIERHQDECLKKVTALLDGNLDATERYGLNQRNDELSKENASLKVELASLKGKMRSIDVQLQARDKEISRQENELKTKINELITHGSVISHVG
jgi:DNA anti-recombination protein RmuC